MRSIGLALLIALGLVASAQADGHLFKVLPQYLDAKGRESLSPSLYDRDAYQAFLRQHPDKRAAFRFAVQWKISFVKSAARKIRVQLRGTAQGGLPQETSVELPLTESHAFRHWDYVTLDAEHYKSFGEITAWRVTLWNGDEQLAEQKSFLW